METKKKTLGEILGNIGGTIKSALKTYASYGHRFGEKSILNKLDATDYASIAEVGMTEGLIYAGAIYALAGRTPMSSIYSLLAIPAFALFRVGQMAYTSRKCQKVEKEMRNETPWV
jgi:hypothetical protein